MRLTKTLAVVLCLLAVPALFAQGDCPQPGSLTFATTLSGSQFGGQGAPNGFGNGFITINPATNQATINMNVGGIGSNITTAGLFQNGTLFLPFTSQNTTFNNGNLSTTITLTPAQMSAILSNPASFNFGVQTAEFPNGALAGMLVPLQTFGGTLSGTAVVGTAGAAGGGGAFTAQLVPNASGNGWILNYSIVPTGTGNALGGITLNQGLTGQNGPVVAMLSNGGTLTNGQLTGSVALTNDQAVALMTNPSHFFLTTNTSAGALRAQLAAVQNELFIPVAGEVAGAAGSRWSTDINIFNESFTQPATVTVEFLPANQGNVTSSGAINAANAATITIQPRSVSAQSGILANLFSIPTGLGALRLVSDQPIAATARIFNDQRGNGRGTLGEVLTAKSLCEALSRGVIVGISTAANGSVSFANRTNIGFFNPTGSPVQVSLILRNQGTIAGRNTMTIPAFGMMQLPSVGNGGGAVFNGINSDIASGAIAYQSSAPIFAYASINDNASGDTSLVFAQPDILGQPTSSEADVAAIVAQADQGEIQLSQLGSRASSMAVQQFAQQMVNTHGVDLQQAQSLFGTLGISASTTNATVTAMQQANQQTIANLNGMGVGRAWDRAFMQAELNVHQQLLNMLDSTLIPAATTPQLIQYLQTVRAEVASHLASAQQILAGLPQ